jgi:hypothetical protein
MAYHIRTVFEDCLHGANMQCSTILKNLHTAALRENSLPEHFTIGADNTPKETKNGTMMAFIIWLLCALSETRLWKVSVVFLMVGHTHDSLD